MIYIHQWGSLNRKEGEALDVKAALKEVAPKMVRRTDRFIQLALLGAYRAVDGNPIDPHTALYMASGQGNLAVFNRLRDQRYIDHQPPKPIDFINSLSNTAGFYVAQFLGLHGKNLNLAQHGFVAEMALLLAQNDLRLGKEDQVLIGGVDELLQPASFTRKFLGICDGRELGEGSNWMLLNTRKEGALASLEVVSGVMSLTEVKQHLEAVTKTTKVAFGLRCNEAAVNALLEGNALERFCYESGCGFYETAAFYAMNRFIEEGEGRMLFIENFEEDFRLFEVDVLQS
ncbi:beta-ketoacyl synthase N-terminal-like domain-containing protein [Sulfurimonas sp. HSL3-7]|uniref:beta-ketoacyl synthase N-terminal-like domain-containing protein n=1 Tax=Sulfonitrofixus jiaomeiensis TaxID=3131938 RepID=UPI0031FA260C